MSRLTDWMRICPNVTAAILDKFHPHINTAIEAAVPENWAVLFIEESALAARAAGSCCVRSGRVVVLTAAMHTPLPRWVNSAVSSALQPGLLSPTATKMVRRDERRRGPIRTVCTAEKQRVFSPLDHREVGHRLTECDVISSAIVRTDEVNE